jgi:hypothetical protein
MTQQLTRYQQSASGEELSTMQLGQVLANSGYFQDAKDAAQAIVKVLAGREMGIGPGASMTGIYIVKGRVTLSANLMAAQIKRSGKYNYLVRRMNDTGCELDFYEGKEKIGTSAFTEADAKAAQLLSGDNWKKFPRNMYFARAMSNGAKWFTPDVFSGPIYTPDELNAEPASYEPTIVNVATGEILSPPEPVQPTTQPVELSDRDRMLRKIAKLTADADALDLEIALRIPLEDMTDAELIAHGKNLRAAIDQAQAAAEQPAEATA